MYFRSYGKSVVSTNIRGPRTLIKNNENGFVFNVNDYENTAKSIELIYNNKDLKAKFETNTKKNVKEYYLDNVLSELSYIYNNINDDKQIMVGDIR